MRKVFLITLCLLFAGCGSSKPVPDWLNTSHNQLEGYKNNYLSGDEKRAASQFKDALSEIKKTGDLPLLARAHLIRMALETVVLEDLRDGEYLKIDDLGPDQQNRNFYLFLKGDAAKVEEDRLPEQYRGILRSIKKGASADYLKEIEKMEGPLSRLIAIGVLVRIRQDNVALMEKALDTASAQGWKKALLAYLERLKEYYLKTGEKEKARGIEGRIKLIH